ncbi:M23 family peptidase, partial [Microbispora sp. RL4-1S]|nr:M23 family peptidase [Microbispora oryzae]
NNDFGGNWASTTDGHRTINNLSGAKMGDVYLMYNSATGDNCVATIKAVDVGTATHVYAGLLVQGGSWKTQNGNYKYYAAVKANATDKCVQYDGDVEYYAAGRYTWGNCG